MRQLVETAKQYPLARPITDSIVGHRDSLVAPAADAVADESVDVLVVRYREFIRSHIRAETVAQPGAELLHHLGARGTVGRRRHFRLPEPGEKVGLAHPFPW